MKSRKRAHQLDEHVRIMKDLFIKMYRQEAASVKPAKRSWFVRVWTVFKNFCLG